MVIVPGTAFAELALRVGGEVGHEAIEELTIEAPLRMPASGSVHVQVTVGQPDDGGKREIEVYSRAGAARGEPPAPAGRGRNASGGPGPPPPPARPRAAELRAARAAGAA